MKKEKNTFDQEIDLFIDHIDGLHQTYPLVNGILKVTQLTSEKKREDFLNTAKFSEDDESNKEFDFSSLNRYLDLQKKANNSKLATEIIQRNFIVSLISQFDAYIGSLIRKKFIIRPELLNNSDKNLTFSKLVEYNSIEELKEYIVEKEIESVLRDSHTNQFKWLENKLGMVLTKDLPSWSTFIELTERRNLFVHSNGIISNQYLSVCKKNEVNFYEDINIGDKLEVTNDYFEKAFFCVYEIAVKLSQVIWRKLLPSNLEDADNDLNDRIYKLIRRKDYKLALNLSEFATDIIKKHSSHEIRLILSVNKAQAYKWDGKDDICKKFLNSQDWSAMSNKFKLSKFILLDDYENAFKLMKKIGNNEDELPKTAYKEWPLFNNIRNEQEFRDLYTEIYNEDYEYVKYDDDEIMLQLEQKYN
ncbi:hypothetical protein [Epilithonimonas sp.]|uniref:hypothetical protein n=1 Tax=Epilithonimonas sp. TaxID=2894511 RepID=UPI002897797E|nr:hypothetical protein [Epilithonimonas sp.]